MLAGEHRLPDLDLRHHDFVGGMREVGDKVRPQGLRAETSE